MQIEGEIHFKRFAQEVIEAGKLKSARWVTRLETQGRSHAAAEVGRLSASSMHSRLEEVSICSMKVFD